MHFPRHRLRMTQLHTKERNQDHVLLMERATDYHFNYNFHLTNIPSILHLILKIQQILQETAYFVFRLLQFNALHNAHAHVYHNNINKVYKQFANKIFPILFFFSISGKEETFTLFGNYLRKIHQPEYEGVDGCKRKIHFQIRRRKRMNEILQIRKYQERKRLFLFRGAGDRIYMRKKPLIASDMKINWIHEKTSRKNASPTGIEQENGNLLFFNFKFSSLLRIFSSVSN